MGAVIPTQDFQERGFVHIPVVHAPSPMLDAPADPHPEEPEAWGDGPAAWQATPLPEVRRPWRLGGGAILLGIALGVALLAGLGALVGGAAVVAAGIYLTVTLMLFAWAHSAARQPDEHEPLADEPHAEDATATLLVGLAGLLVLGATVVFGLHVMAVGWLVVLALIGLLGLDASVRQQQRSRRLLHLEARPDREHPSRSDAPYAHRHLTRELYGMRARFDGGEGIDHLPAGTPFVFGRDPAGDPCLYAYGREYPLTLDLLARVRRASEPLPEGGDAAPIGVAPR